jgi:hypothetical protein
MKKLFGTVVKPCPAFHQILSKHPEQAIQPFPVGFTPSGGQKEISKPLFCVILNPIQF